MVEVVKTIIKMERTPMLRFREFLDHAITRQAMSETINQIGAKATTQVRRHLASQTKLPYAYMMKAVSLRRAWPANLQATIEVKEDRVPNLGRFMTSYTKRPKSWRKKGWQQKMRLRVWAGTQLFPKSPTAKPFVLDKGSYKLIAVRKGKSKLPLKFISGPNISGSPGHGEVERLETGTYIKIELPEAVDAAIDERIDRLIAAAPTK